MSLRLNLALEGAQQFSSGNWHFYESNVKLYRNLAEGTTAKAQGTTATAVDELGYFKACNLLCENNDSVF